MDSPDILNFFGSVLGKLVEYLIHMSLNQLIHCLSQYLETYTEPYQPQLKNLSNVVKIH